MDLLPKIKRGTMTLFLVRDVFRLICTLARLEFCAMHLELMSVDHEIIETVPFVNIRFNSDSALVREVTAELDIMNGDIVV